MIDGGQKREETFPSKKLKGGGRRISVLAFFIYLIYSSYILSLLLCNNILFRKKTDSQPVPRDRRKHFLEELAIILKQKQKAKGLHVFCAPDVM